MQYLFPEITINSQSVSRIHFECSILFSIFSLFISRMHYNLTIFLSNLLWIHLNQPSLSRIPYTFRIPFEFQIHNTVIFGYSLSIHHLFRQYTSNLLFFREFTLNSLSFFRIRQEFTTFFANSLWKFTISKIMVD